MVSGLRYGSSRRLPSTVSPVLARHSTVWPPTAITRLTRSFSSGGTNPKKENPFSIHRTAGLSERIDLYPMFQLGGPLKTITSPGSGDVNRYVILSTMIRSPVQPGQPCSVGSIDSEGIRYGRATNVNMT